MEQEMFVPVTSRAQIEQVAHLAREIWHEHYGTLLGKAQIEYMLAKFQSAEAVARQLAHQGYLYYLIMIDGQACGYLGLQPQENALFLSKLYVQKRARGRGVARQALALMRRVCREKGLPKIYLTVNKQNASKQVYEALGFTITKEETTDIGQGFVMDDYIMETNA